LYFSRCSQHVLLQLVLFRVRPPPPHPWQRLLPLQGAACFSHCERCTATGPIFLLTWPLYPAPSLLVNLTAASIPALATVHFIVVGLGIIQDPAFVSAVGHGPGQERKLLEGPTQYGIVLACLVAAAFRTPLSVLAFAVLCFGDATAALVGRHCGRVKLPWCRRKV
jgi:hypothetical protein